MTVLAEKEEATASIAGRLLRLALNKLDDSWEPLDTSERYGLRMVTPQRADAEFRVAFASVNGKLATTGLVTVALIEATTGRRVPLRMAAVPFKLQLRSIEEAAKLIHEALGGGR